MYNAILVILIIVLVIYALKRAGVGGPRDEENMAKIGDVVTVEECKPYSKSKTWKLLMDSQEAPSEAETQES